MSAETAITGGSGCCVGRVVGLVVGAVVGDVVDVVVGAVVGAVVKVVGGGLTVTSPGFTRDAFPSVFVTFSITV